MSDEPDDKKAETAYDPRDAVLASLISAASGAIVGGVFGYLLCSWGVL